jgi:transketolase
MIAREFKSMRDVFLERIHLAMKHRDDIFLVSDDFGSRVLDKIRDDFSDRFINVGIAEQNCINVAAGLALEGYTVFAYGIACFMSMRSFEQIRVNVSMTSQLRPLNLNIVGVGAGLSYDVSGPSHHCLEDLTLLRLLPHVDLFSPSDWQTAARLADYSVEKGGPKYFRFDSKPAPAIYSPEDELNLAAGFHELAQGEDTCIVSTGFMTHVALKTAARADEPIGVIDVFGLKPADQRPLYESLRRYDSIVTLEEGFIKRGGLDSFISCVLAENGSQVKLTRLGVDDRYLFELGGRERLHRICGIDEEGVLEVVSKVASA